MQRADSWQSWNNARDVHHLRRGTGDHLARRCRLLWLLANGHRVDIRVPAGSGPRIDGRHRVEQLSAQVVRTTDASDDPQQVPPDAEGDPRWTAASRGG